MKNIIIFSLALVFASFSHAETSFKELQSLTNMITLAHTKFVSGKLLIKHLSVLKKAENKDGEKPSDEAISEAKAFTNAFIYAKEFDNIPPAKAIPILFDLLENDNLTDHMQVFCDGMYTNSFGEWVYQLIMDKMNLEASFSPESVTMLWVPKGSMIIDRKEFLFFWYYAGLKHLPVLWNDWYNLWKNETQRQDPRPDVLKRLAEEINRQFGYHLFPYVAEAIKNGDRTLQPLLDELPRDGGYHYSFLLYPPANHIDGKIPEEVKPYFPVPKQAFSNDVSFVEWWNLNKDDYIFAQPKTKLADLKHIAKRKYRPNVIDETRYKAALRLEKALDEYCALKDRPISNCWYFSLKEENDSEQ